MPVYEYECGECGRVTETIRRMSEADAPIPCESCGSDRTTRKHSVFAAAPGKSGAASDAPMCGHCGGPPGSCAM